jgi:molybdenum ABC transporter molybdate-binding protein
MKTPYLPADWSVGIRVWIERAGKSILGKGRMELLAGIQETHSISAAARQMGMSYRQAWLLVQSMNEGAGEPLVRTATGGEHGGGAQLTLLGNWALDVFRALQGEMQQAAATVLPRIVQGSAAASVHVVAAVAVDEVLGGLLTDFAVQRPDIRVRVVFGASDELADHLLAGAPGDLFITASSAPLERLQAAGVVDRRSRAVLAKNSLAVIAAADQPLPIRRLADLAWPEVTRIAMPAATTPLGAYAREYLDQSGLANELMPRALEVDSSRAVLATVRAGGATVGLAYGSDAATAAGCRVLFRAVPPRPIEFSGAVLRLGHQPAQAESLLSFLRSPAAQRRFRQCGFLPLRSRKTG